MNEITDRFYRAEQLLLNQIQSGELLCADDHIIFQTGKANSAVSAYGCLVVCGVGAFLMSQGAHSFAECCGIPSWVAWVFTALMTAGLGCLCFSN